MKEKEETETEERVQERGGWEEEEERKEIRNGDGKHGEKQEDR